MVTFRPSRPGDAPAIRDVLLAAFPGPDEADLVDALRADGDIALEWVAEDAGRIVGVIDYSPLALVRDAAPAGAALALAPVAVSPERQAEGIGGELIRRTLDMLRTGDHDAVVVLGHPDYYPRFGFSAETAAHALVDPFDAGSALMALPLRDGGLPAGQARLRYARAFGLPA